MSMQSNLREIGDDELRRQLTSSSTTTLKRRHLPLAFNLYKKQQLLSKHVSTSRSHERYQNIVDSIKNAWDKNREIQQKFIKIRNVIDNEIKKLREWELEMVRFGEKHPESMVINDASWHWQQDQYKFVHPRVRARNAQYQFIRNLKRFGPKMSIQQTKFNELYGEWKCNDPDLKHLPWPTVAGESINLYDLYRGIVMLGGLGKTLKKTVAWKNIGSQMRLYGTPDTLFYQLRVIYYKYLLSFEHKYQVIKIRGARIGLKNTWVRPHESDDEYFNDYEYVDDDDNQNDDDYDYHEERRKKLLKKKKQNNEAYQRNKVKRIPFDNACEPSHKKRKMNDDNSKSSHFESTIKHKNITTVQSHNMFGKYKKQFETENDNNSKIQSNDRHFGQYWNGFHMVRALVLSLQSNITSNVNWALNRLLYLSYNTKSKMTEPFIIKDHSKELVDAMLSLVDINRNPGILKVVLRILSNLALTSENQQSMTDHDKLLPFLLKMVRCRMHIQSDCDYTNKDSDYTEIHVSAIRVIARLSAKITLSKWSKKCSNNKHESRLDLKRDHTDKDCEFVTDLVRVLSDNLCIAHVIDLNENKNWMLYYTLMICCNLAANPNNESLLSEFVICDIDEENKQEMKEFKVKTVDLSETLHYNNGFDTSKIMLFADDDDDKDDSNEKNDEKFEWINRISVHVMSVNCRIMSYAIECLIYLMKCNNKFSEYLLKRNKDLIGQIMDITCDHLNGQQLRRSASYLLALMYKQNKTNKQFNAFNNRIFEGCAQYDEVACYAFRLSSLNNDNLPSLETI